MVEALDERQRTRLLTITATMVKYAVEQYRSPAQKLYEVRDKVSSRSKIALRNAMERLVLHGERVLEAVVSPAQSPELMDAMRELNRAEMKLRWNKWARELQNRLNRDFSITELPAAGE
jgi:hypothetical protein